MVVVSEKVIERHEDVMGGTPVFVGTRVPVRTLTDYLVAGDTLDDFLDNFPAVERGQAVAFLELARITIEAQINQRSNLSEQST